MWFQKSLRHPRLSISHGSKLQKALDHGKEYGALLTDLYKAFNCLPLIESLKLINSNLPERKQRVKINYQFNSWMDILFGVAQGSILGPILFNIFLCDMFLFCKNVGFASYVDDNAQNSRRSNKSVREIFNILFSMV